MIAIFGTANCEWCVKAVELCREHGEDFEYHDIGDNEAAKTLIRATNKTVPMIVSGETRIGGYKQLVMWLHR